MNRTKNLDKLIRHIIKSGVIDYFDNEIQNILNKISDENIKLWWLHFDSTYSFVKMNREIPDWKTNDQKKFIEMHHLENAYYPLNWRSDGNYDKTFNRKHFETHIKKVIKKYIEENIKLNTNHKNRSLAVRIYMYSLVAILLLTPLFMISTIFKENDLMKNFPLLCYSVYVIFLIMCAILAIKKSK